MVLFAAVEAGGTSFVVAVVEDDAQNILEQKSIETRNPDETLRDVVQFFVEYQNKTNRSFDSLGVASFGPIDLNRNSKTYGYITSTPKLAWKNCDILGTIRKGLGNIDCFGFDTDVNGAALAMSIHFSGDRKVDSLAYCTVGTGVGVGILSNDRLVHGLLHPEAGHVYFPRAEGDSKEEFQGTCPFHGDCLEGLVASASLAKRKSISAKELASLEDSDKVWEYASYYLAHLCVMLASTVSPQVIVIGGGIMQREILFQKIIDHATKLCNNYLGINFQQIIHPSPFGQNAGIIGAASLAQKAFAAKLLVIKKDK